MSEEKDPYKSEEPSWEEESAYQEEKLSVQEQPVQEYQYGAATQPPMEQPTELTEEELARKKKRRRIILIVIFGVITPILAFTLFGFLIWGIVVGFTECSNSCSDCFNTCCGCSDSCTGCCDTCNDCGSSCDNCCSSDSINKTSARSVTSLKMVLKNNLQIVQWYYYSIIEFLKSIFIK
jgi:hypothetical protein